MPPRILHLIFDLDGTLIDSAPSILAGFEGALKQHHLQPVLPLNEKLIGPPLKETLKLLTGITDPHRIEALADSFKCYYDAEGYKASRVYPDIGEVLARLKQEGHILHIATNKRLNPTLKILQYFGWQGLFTHVYALDCQTPAFPDKTAMLAGLLAQQGINPGKALYVGDKREDGEAAERNRLPFIAVAWGYGDFSGSEPGWHHARTAADLQALLQRI